MSARSSVFPGPGRHAGRSPETAQDGQTGPRGWSGSGTCLRACIGGSGAVGTRCQRRRCPRDGGGDDWASTPKLRSFVAPPWSGSCRAPPLASPAAEFEPRCDQFEVGLLSKEKANGAFWRLLQFPRTPSEVSSEPSDLVDPSVSLRWVEMQTIGPRGRHEIAPSAECRAPEIPLPVTRAGSW